MELLDECRFQMKIEGGRIFIFDNLNKEIRELK